MNENADPETRSIVQENSCRLLTPDSKGYGAAIKAGLKEARGIFILTMDADLSHSPDFIYSLWNAAAKRGHHHRLEICDGRQGNYASYPAASKQNRKLGV